MKKRCGQCGKPSIKGLKKGQGLCQYHYNVVSFGKEWADKVVAETKAFMSGSKERI
jgi:hypothetical protein